MLKILHKSYQWLLICFFCGGLAADDWSLSYQYSRSDSSFGLPIDTSIEVQSLQFDWLGDEWQFGVTLPQTRIEGPAVFFGAVPLRWLVLVNRDRRRLFFNRLGVTSIDDIVNASVSGISDATVSTGYQISDQWLDPYILSINLDVKLDNGDAERGLGTGTIDTIFSVDYQYLFESWAPQISAGRLFSGGGTELALDDFEFVDIGFTHFINDSFSWSVSHYVGLLKNDQNIEQTQVSLDWNASENFSLAVSSQIGQSDTSLDSVYSLQLSYQF